LLTHGGWFSPGSRASSTTTTGRDDIAETLLKVALKHKKNQKSNLLFLLYLRNGKSYSISVESLQTGIIQKISSEKTGRKQILK
jgi:hypothetical protein